MLVAKDLAFEVAVVRPWAWPLKNDWTVRRPVSVFIQGEKWLKNINS